MVTVDFQNILKYIFIKGHTYLIREFCVSCKIPQMDLSNYVDHCLSWFEEVSKLMDLAISLVLSFLSEDITPRSCNEWALERTDDS